MQSRQWHHEGSVILVCVNKHKTPRSSGYERTKKFKSDILVSFHDVGLNLHSIYRPSSIQTSAPDTAAEQSEAIKVNAILHETKPQKIKVQSKGIFIHKDICQQD